MTWKMLRILLGWYFVLVLMAQAQTHSPPMLKGRQRFFALPRQDGKVYLFGDTGALIGNDFLELYDSATRSERIMPVLGHDTTGEWALLLSNERVFTCSLPCVAYDTRTRDILQPLVSGTVTPIVQLLSGQILRAGGRQGPIVSDFSFLIDPVTFRSQETGRMARARAVDTMIRLKDGRVLAPGGWASGVSRMAEIFDPGTNEWTVVASLERLSAFLRGVCLSDGRALVANDEGAEIYDPITNRWRFFSSFVRTDGSTLVALPNGQAVAVGGNREGRPSRTVLIFDAAAETVQEGRPLGIARANHASAVLPDGTVLVFGGTSDDGIATSSVEKLAWEPRVSLAAAKEFYIATSTARSAADAGFWGIEIAAPGRLHGGLNFGGMVPARGGDVGFAGFNLPEAQAIAGRIDFQPLGSGNFEAVVRLLDVNKQPVAPEIRGGTHIEFSQQLPPGFYVVEVQTGANSPTASYQFALSAPVLSGGAVAGGVLDPATGVPGFAGFYLAEPQDVTVRLLNEQTYGSPRGAGEVILTLYDSQGRIIARQGPGAMGN
jgi:hypothetical protein